MTHGLIASASFWGRRGRPEREGVGKHKCNCIAASYAEFFGFASSDDCRTKQVDRSPLECSGFENLLMRFLSFAVASMCLGAGLTETAPLMMLFC